MEKKYALLPADDVVQNWFEENIDKECSASSAIYKFRLWLESLQVTRQAGAVWVKAEKLRDNIGIPYHAKDEESKGAGCFDIHGSFIWGDGSITFKHCQDDLFILDESPAEQPAWINSDTKPEHNVGVLVFIPGEDNHITSGMWDVSNEWVLLDEYRTPEEEVTHWMPLPVFPEGHDRFEIPSELADTIKKIAKEELAKKPKAAEQPERKESDAVAFAEWCQKKFIPIYEGDRIAGWRMFGPPEYGNPERTTAQLYQLFKEQKEET